MAFQSRHRAATLALLAAVVSAATLALLTDAGGAVARGTARTPAQTMLLRAADLGRGFSILHFGEGTSSPGLICAPLHPATPGPELAAWLKSDKPHGCMALYARILRHGKRLRPQVVGTAALDAGDEGAAVEGLALAKQLLSEVGSGLEPTEATPPGTVGEETRLFRWPHTIFTPGHPGGSVLTWRSGDVLCAVFAEGEAVAANDRRALRLARRQQKHVEHPTPFNPGR